MSPPPLPTPFHWLALSFTSGASEPAAPGTSEATEPPVQRPVGSPPILPEPAAGPQPETEPEPSVAPGPEVTPVESEPVVAPAPGAAPQSAETPVDPFDDPLAAAPATESKRPFVLGPSTRRFVFGFSVGQTWSLYTPGGGFRGARLRLEQSFAGHRKGRGDGVIFGLVLQQGVGRMQSDFVFAPRVQWDLPLAKNVGAYLSPSILAGYNLRRSYSGYAYSYYEEYNYTGHHMVLQFGLTAKIAIVDRLMLSFRPVLLELVTEFSGVEIRWDVVGGLGITF